MFRTCIQNILSRISIPFGMLSVCTGQVTHALLTRPPHVLGTPPAFILSQDQTLKIKFPAQTNHYRISGLVCLVSIRVN